MARAIVICESFRDVTLPPSLEAREARRYAHALDGRQPVTIVEADLHGDEIPSVMMEISRSLKPRLYYAHIWTPDILYICFPDVVAIISQGDTAAEMRAVQIGRMFDIPASQMRFDAMSATDHPDTKA